MARIFVIDDSPVVRRTLAFTLQRQGHEVEAAVDGHDALQQLQSQKPDLIFCDIDMPEMNGIDLLSRLRADARWQGTPIIMLTASGMDADRERAEAEGANGFLTKPASSGEIISVVERSLTR